MTSLSLSLSTWRLLGLSTAAGYAGLGLFDMLFPRSSALLLGLWPEISEKALSTNDQHEELKAAVMLMGARDISIAIALLAFDYKRDFHAMGTLILGGTFLCLADVVWVWSARGWKFGLQLGAGAMCWTGIGYGLLCL